MRETEKEREENKERGIKRDREEEEEREGGSERMRGRERGGYEQGEQELKRDKLIKQEKAEIPGDVRVARKRQARKSRLFIDLS